MQDLTKKQLSEFPSRKEWEDYLWSQIVRKFSAKKTYNETELLLKDLFSTHERKRMIRRAIVLSLVAQGKSYREISKIVWISPNTISSLKKSILNKTGYISRHMRVKIKEVKPKPLSSKEWAKLRVKLWFEGLFVIPSSPRIFDWKNRSRKI